jgi:hypothetical protein
MLAFGLFGVLGILFLLGLGIALGRTATDKVAAERQPADVVQFQAASRRRTVRTSTPRPELWQKGGPTGIGQRLPVQPRIH